MSRTRVLAVVALLLLAPFSAEYLLGSISIRSLPVLPFLIPLYGAAALLIRETARRSERGWPTMLLLGLAFGFLQAGIVDGSLFNSHYEGMKLVGAEVPGLHFSATFGLAFVVNHAVLSIGAPIALVEAALVDADGADQRRTEPWLPVWALPVVALLFLGGCLLIGWDNQNTEHFYPSAVQIGATGAVVVLLITIAFAQPKLQSTAPEPDRAEPNRAEPNRAEPDRTGPKEPTTAPHPFAVGLLAAVASTLFFLVPPNYSGVVHGVLLVVFVSTLVSRWSGRPGWGGDHRLALVAGAWLVSGCASFYVGSFIGQSDLVTQLGHGVFGLVALVIVIVIAARQPKSAKVRI